MTTKTEYRIVVADDPIKTLANGLHTGCKIAMVTCEYCERPVFFDAVRIGPLYTAEEYAALTSEEISRIPILLFLHEECEFGFKAGLN